ncbi:MAG: DUF952 domain-containing protein [Candidatus Paceibacterota bacterium]
MNKNKLILHIANEKEWQTGEREGSYKGDTLDTEGFIHCSKLEQVEEVAEHLFKGRKNLKLLRIDSSKVIPKIIYEDAGNGKLYPHIFGPLNLDAVISIEDYSVE